MLPLRKYLRFYVETQMKQATKLAIASAVLAATGAIAYAATATENDAQAAVRASANAKTTLTQAISIAEQHSQGKAVKAEYERQKGGQWVYEVEVVSGQKVFDVKVDADKGTVIAANEDKADRENEHDKKD